MQQDKKKVEYAEKVANEITQNQFENDMNIIFSALTKAGDRAFD
jgi:hypothetical protein